MEEYGHKLKLMLLLGDDQLAFIRGNVDTQKLLKLAKVKDGMVLKPKTDQHIGNFC